VAVSLIVKWEFGGLRVGDEIVDDHEVIHVLSGPNAFHVVPVRRTSSAVRHRVTEPGHSVIPSVTLTQAMRGLPAGHTVTDMDTIASILRSIDAGHVIPTYRRSNSRLRVTEDGRRRVPGGVLTLYPEEVLPLGSLTLNAGALALNGGVLTLN
jgi:hypothetical protein